VHGEADEGEAKHMKRQHPDNPDLFWCPKCQTYKERGEFAISRQRSSGVASVCKECMNEHTRVFYQDNLVKQRERSKAKQARHRKVIGKEGVAVEAKEQYAKHRERVIRHEVEYIKNRRKLEPEWDKEWRARYKAKLVLELRDNYLTALLNRVGIFVAPETIELKREQIILQRELKQLKGEL
jgi:hypothetical protein